MTHKDGSKVIVVCGSNGVEYNTTALRLAKNKSDAIYVRDFVDAETLAKQEADAKAEAVAIAKAELKAEADAKAKPATKPKTSTAAKPKTKEE